MHMHVYMHINMSCIPPTVVHCGSTRQTASIVSMNQDHLRTGDKASCRFRFIKNPEYIRPDTRMVFREGRTKAVGNITKIHPYIPGSSMQTVKQKSSYHHHHHHHHGMGHGRGKGRRGRGRKSTAAAVSDTPSCSLGTTSVNNTTSSSSSSSSGAGGSTIASSTSSTIAAVTMSH